MSAFSSFHRSRSFACIAHASSVPHPQEFGKTNCLLELTGHDLIGLPLNSPLSVNPVIYALPMLTILTDKGEEWNGFEGV